VAAGARHHGPPDGHPTPPTHCSTRIRRHYITPHRRCRRYTTIIVLRTWGQHAKRNTTDRRSATRLWIGARAASNASPCPDMCLHRPFEWLPKGYVPPVVSHATVRSRH
jgi:hypothetical protein